MIITDLLKDGIGKKLIKQTNETSEKIFINGHSASYPIYEIPLDLLYFNDKNDRIATWISKYKAENHAGLKTYDRENYNNIIENFIIESNPDAIKKTKNNIRNVGQLKSGIVLNDGRIIDGNRRYTCLRQLNKENPLNNGYFRAVILNFDLTNNEKQIKTLELLVQIGEDKKVSYNPIDRLVGIYNDLINEATRLFGVEEYSKITNEDVSDVRKNIEYAKLMVEYLDWINAPMQFHIARDNKIEGSLEEIYKIVKKGKTDEEIDKLKQILFLELLMVDGDISKYIRKTGVNIISSKYAENFLDENLEYAQKAQEILLNPENQNLDKKELISLIRSNEELKQNMDKSRTLLIEKNQREQIINRPAELVNKSIEVMESIDLNIFKKLTESQIEDVKKSLSKLEDLLNTIRTNIED